MEFKQQILYLLAGILVYYVIKQIRKSTNVKFPQQKLDTLFFEFNLFLLIWNISFTLALINITSGGNIMSSNDLHSIASWAQAFGILAFIFGGLILASLIDMIYEGIIARRKSQRIDMENEIRLIAYQLWENEGHHSGHDMEYWLKAKAIWEKLNKKTNLSEGGNK